MGRKAILDLLAERPGEFVSGEMMSQHLNLTRAAVWKQIQALKALGFEVDSQTKSGYRLVKLPLALDEWILERELRTNALGRELHLFDTLPSTNDWVKDAARNGGVHGLVAIAKEQGEGRGRQKRCWVSPRGGLWFSVLLKPQLSLADAAKLTLVASISVADGIEAATGISLGIKWPNDLLFEGRKVVGILGEVAGEWNTVQSIVLGIGINANLSRQQIGDDIAADTLQAILGRPMNLNTLTARILEHLEVDVEVLERQGFSSLRQRWLHRAVGIGTQAQINQGSEVFTGTFQGISEDGELILAVEGGEKVFAAGEVSVRSEHGTYFQ